MYALIVDDRKEICNIVQELCDVRDIVSVSVNTFDQAMDNLYRKFDILIVDYCLDNDRIGPEFIHKYKMQHHDCKVILYTGHDEKINSDIGKLYKIIGYNQIANEIDSLLKEIENDTNCGNKLNPVNHAYENEVLNSKSARNNTGWIQIAITILIMLGGLGANILYAGRILERIDMVIRAEKEDRSSILKIEERQNRMLAEFARAHGVIIP